MSDKCQNDHEWTHQFGDDWIPEYGTPCDCGKKLWGIPIKVIKEHKWEFYANDSFCTKCGAQIGSGQSCR